MPDVLLCGANLAVLVAAHQLAEAGADVLVLTGGDRLGGHFAGVRAGEGSFDMGLVVLDRSHHADRGAPLSDYDPWRRYDWTRFGARIDEWVTQRARLVQASPAQCYVAGDRWPDHLSGDRTDVIRTRGHGSTPDLPVDDPRHASHKSDPSYDELLYDDVAPLHHGAAVHAELVEPFADKVLGGLRNTLLARYHRQAWLPLLWPTTVAAAREGHPQADDAVGAWVFASGSLGHLVEGLAREVSASRAVAVDATPVLSVSRHGQGWAAVTAGGGVRCAGEVVFGASPRRVARWLSLPEPVQASTQLSLALLEVRAGAIRSPIGTINAVDRDCRWYRMTDQDQLSGRDPEWHRVVVEYGPAVTGGQGLGGVAVRDVQCLLGVDCVSDIRPVSPVIRAGLVPSTVDNVRNHLAFLRTLESAAPGALMTGHVAGLGATTVNDQILQGLRVAEALGPNP